MCQGTDTKKRTLDPGPLAFMIRLLRTSAGEQTVVATVPCHIHLISVLSRDRKELIREHTAAKLAVKWQKMLSSK